MRADPTGPASPRTSTADGQGRAVAPKAMFGIASITKTFIAAEVLKLARAGKVDLDAPLSRYVRHRLAGNGATVRQTLGMVSGLRDKDVAVRTIIGDPGRRWTPEQAIDVIAGDSLKPGGDPDYDNVNYMLLGLLVRRRHPPTRREGAARRPPRARSRRSRGGAAGGEAVAPDGGPGVGLASGLLAGTCRRSPPRASGTPPAGGPPTQPASPGGGTCCTEGACSHRRWSGR